MCVCVCIYVYKFLFVGRPKQREREREREREKVLHVGAQTFNSVVHENLQTYTYTYIHLPAHAYAYIYIYTVYVSMYAFGTEAATHKVTGCPRAVKRLRKEPGPLLGMWKGLGMARGTQ